MSEPIHPRHDPDFRPRLATDLLEHPAEYRPLGRLYAEHVPSYERCCLVREAVEWAERHMGMVVDAERGRGYRCLAVVEPRTLKRRRVLAGQLRWPLGEG